jgi:4-hydroxy-2-oxoglutarate aldolase
MPKTLNLRGVFPPIPTPFESDGEVAYGALADNLDRWNCHGLAGYVVLGSNGEAGYLTEAEKHSVLETARDAIGSDKLLIAGTGCESTRQTIALTREAAEIGADAALLLTPHYYGGQMTPDSLVHHYWAIAEVSPIPVLVYNVPKFTHVDMDVATILRASEHPNVIGIKDSSGNIAKLTDVVRLAPADFQVLVGTASVLFAGLTLGAVGGVVALSNIAPAEAIDIQCLHDAGRWAEAAALQRRMLPVNAAVTARFGVPGLKAALDMLGYYGGPVRSPLLALGQPERELLRAILAEGGIL